jgi:VanZ family protein
LLYTVILVPSALWMPLTFAMMQQPSSGLWLAIRLTLAFVGTGSLGLWVALLTLRPRQPAWAYGLAVIGCMVFCVQTALLDAWVWPAFFPASP